MTAQLTQRDRALLDKYGHLGIIDTTSRRRWTSCRRKAWLQNHPPLGLGLRKKLMAPPLFFGTLIHEALDAHYDPTEICPAWEVFDLQCRQEIKRITSEYKPWPEQLEQYTRLHDLGIAMLQEYERWSQHHDRHLTVIDTERAGFIPITRRFGRSNRVIGLYYVRFDGIVRDDAGHLWVMEHKTCGRWWTEAMLMLDEQITAYTWAAQYWYGEPVAGVLLNCLLKEAVKDPMILKSGEPTRALNLLGYVTADRYRAVVQNWTDAHKAAYEYLLQRERHEGHPTIRREAIARSPHQVALQHERIVDQFVAMHRDREHVAHPSPSFTCGSCPVYDLCVQIEEGADWRTTAKLLYEEAPPIWAEHDLEEAAA